MRTDGLIGLLAGGLGAVAAVAIAISVVVLRENGELRAELRDARGEVRQALQSERRQSEERIASETLLASQRERAGSLERDLEALRVQAAKTAEPGPGQAIRVRAFVGREPIGGGWLLPPPRPDGTNRAPAEAVVVLDESTRTALAGGTAKADRAGPGDTTIHHNYPSQAYSYWWGWWPAYWTPTVTNDIAAGGSRFPVLPPRPSPEPSPFLPTTYYLPREKPYLPNPSPWPGVTPPGRSIMPPGGGSGGAPPSAPMPIKPLSGGGVGGILGR